MIAAWLKRADFLAWSDGSLHQIFGRGAAHPVACAKRLWANERGVPIAVPVFEAANSASRKYCSDNQ